MVYSPNCAKVLMIITLATTLVFLCSSSSSSETGQLSPNFYDVTCPHLLAVVKKGLRQNIRTDKRMGASLLRLHFHDCFVNGCDGSILLRGGERDAPANKNSTRGYNIIDDIKSRVEQACANTVSCADILALVARESVVSLGAPRWDLDFGRRDSKSSANIGDVNSNLPSPHDDLGVLGGKFKNKGFSIDEMVALSGAHTIGQAQCINFRDGISNKNTTFAINAQKQCPKAADGNLLPLDIQTPDQFDNKYYRDLIVGEALLYSDQQLYNGNANAKWKARAKLNVNEYWKNSTKFSVDFAKAMQKMSRLFPLLGNQGEIRKYCSLKN